MCLNDETHPLYNFCRLVNMSGPPKFGPPSMGPPKFGPPGPPQGPPLGPPKFGPLPQGKALECYICTSPISREQKITLSCSHSFHKDCLASYAEAHTDAIFRNEIQCVQCEQPIDGNILQEVMTADAFNKYCVKLAAAQNDES